MSDSERNPPLAEVLRRHIAGALEVAHTMLPAVVTAYDASLQRVSVKPLVKHGYLDETGARKLESLPIITGVPVQFQSAGGFMLTCPISDGRLQIEGTLVKATTGMVIFSEESLDRWLSGTGAEVDPEIDHRFALSDGVFVPGLNPFGSPLAGVPTDHATFGAVGGTQVHVHKTVVVVASGDVEAAAADAVAKATGINYALAAIKTAALLANPVAFLSSLATAVGAPAWPTDVGATRLKSK